MNRLRHYRQTREMGQHALALAVHVSQPAISRIEYYNDLPSPSQAKRLADYFGVKVERMFPDGVREKPNCRHVEEGYLPPEPAPRVYPREFVAICKRCGYRLHLVTDDRHMPFDGEPTCSCCAMPIRDIVPLEEAAHV